MARIAEIIVEDWLNRQGYFTIRGLKKRGRNEVDLLGFRPKDRAALHVEVISNDKPTGWLGGSLKGSALDEEKVNNVGVYVGRKFHGASKQLRDEFAGGLDWRLMLVFNALNDKEEQTRILKDRFCVESVSLSDILGELARKDGLPFYTDSDAAHFAEIADAHRNIGDSK